MGVTAKSMVLIKGIISRLLYIAHAALAIWRVYHETNVVYYWALATSIILLLIEGVISFYYREGKDWGWFSPSVFLYLCGLIPSVWILELNASTGNVNLTAECFKRVQSVSFNANVSAFSKLYLALQQKENWMLAIEQGTLFILIIGRWLTPLGRLTRNQHSQLLLIYIGTAADIMELFETFDEPNVRANRTLVTIIMAVWTWSLLQYTIVFISIKKKPHPVKGSRQQIRPDENSTASYGAHSQRSSSSDTPDSGCCDPEIATPLIAIVMQDIPFLALRFYLLNLGIMSPMLLFFTGKNILIVVLQCYRLFVVCCDRDNEINDSEKSWVNEKKHDDVGLEIVE